MAIGNSSNGGVGGPAAAEADAGAVTGTSASPREMLRLVAELY